MSLCFEKYNLAKMDFFLIDFSSTFKLKHLEEYAWKNI